MGNFQWCKNLVEMPPDPLEVIFMFFVLVEWTHDTQTTFLPVDFRKLKANLVTRRNEKVKKQAGKTTTESFVGGPIVYESIWTPAEGKKLVFWTKEVSAADLDFDSIFCSLFGILYSSRVISLYYV